MNILSIYLWHNSTIAYMENDELHYVLQEEKFDNVKNSDNFPIKSMRYLATKVDLSSLDKITVVGKWINYWMLRYIENFTKDDKHQIINSTPCLYDRIFYRLAKFAPWFLNWVNDTFLRYRKIKYTDKVLELISLWLGRTVKKEEVEFIEHHMCHTLSVVYFYGLHHLTEPVLVMTLDGAGDKHCATVRIWDNGKITTIGTTRYWYSIGDLWSKSFTGGMGMQPLEHEYKVMGLAAYTSKKYFQSAYDRLFKWTIRLNWVTRTSRVPWFKSHIYYHDKTRGLRFDNIAWALQEYTEEIVLQWIHNAVEQTGIKKVAFAGGVFMNVKLNQKIQEDTLLEKVWFMPSAGDDSTPVWWVLAGYMSLWADLKKLPAVKTMYSSVGYTDDEVGKFLDTLPTKQNYTIKKFADTTDLVTTVASMLRDFQIVAIFQGQGERWARSLCNRAILGNASRLETFFTVNDMIKMRDFWMPFAPTILEEYAPNYIKNRELLKNRVQDSAYYMITAFDSTPLAQDHIKAALHQKDKTIRPQLVNETTNPLMYAILKEYESLTGMGGVMNTSLNIHGYPLVGSLEQAIFTLENSGLQHIVLNTYLVSKKA